MLEIFITKYLLEAIIVLLFGMFTKFLLMKFGEDRAKAIENAILTAMLWAENEYGIGTGAEKWEKAWSKIIAILKGQNITIKPKEISYVQDIMKARIPEINEIVYSAMPDSVRNARVIKK